MWSRLVQVGVAALLLLGATGVFQVGVLLWGACMMCLVFVAFGNPVGSLFVVWARVLLWGGLAASCWVVGFQPWYAPATAVALIIGLAAVVSYDWNSNCVW